ncbi:hypothetical protein RRG08_037970 [Elysia crispata]|uniref:Uncharacterized protein n=1 Tax=Elysia crispata TaxID=231223 RepID=A0AAE1ABT9_9GAST|nr:hypothetical protein RRG08_037970 [Elysia crispata]
MSCFLQLPFLFNYLNFHPRKHRARLPSCSKSVGVMAPVVYLLFLSPNRGELVSLDSEVYGANAYPLFTCQIAPARSLILILSTNLLPRPRSSPADVFCDSPDVCPHDLQPCYKNSGHQYLTLKLTQISAGCGESISLLRGGDDDDGIRS